MQVLAGLRIVSEWVKVTIKMLLKKKYITHNNIFSYYKKYTWEFNIYLRWKYKWYFMDASDNLMNKPCFW